jgi:hypothetical protein
MSPMDPNEIPSSRARRHFLGVAGATGAKLAGIAAVTMAIASSPARAMGRNWGGPRGGGGGGNGGGGGHGHGGSDGDGAKCLLRGSSIATPAGVVRIEDLKVGDLVETISGKAKAVRWVGRQVFKTSRGLWAANVMPIRISRGAFADGVPSRDLYVSPGHAVYVDGVLIRARDLVNNTTIAAALPSSSDTIEYYNVLLDSHDVLLAEGMPVESFQLWDDGHESFDNFIEVEKLHPANTRMASFAPVIGEESGRQHLKALLLLGVAHIVPTRDRFKELTDRIAARAAETVH